MSMSLCSEPSGWSMSSQMDDHLAMSWTAKLQNCVLSGAPNSSTNFTQNARIVVTPRYIVVLQYVGTHWGHLVRRMSL